MRLICYKSHYQDYQNITPPFDIPDSWLWVNIKDICSKIGSGSTPKGSNYSLNGIPFFRSQNIHNEGLLYADIKYISEEIHKSMIGTEVIAGDLLLNITGGSLGRCAVVPENFIRGNVSQHVCILRPIFVHPQYFHYLILSSDFAKAMSLTGSGREGLPKYNLEVMYFPLPPIDEQARIVAIVQAFQDILSLLESSKACLADEINKAKAKILDLAMQGKIVPQDPADEPAAEMLRRINPKAKIITDNPHLRNIPKEWCWVKLKDICIKIVDGDHNPPMGQTIDTGFYMISASNIVNNDIIISPSRFITEDQFILCNNRTNVSKGDVLLTTVGSIGRTAIFSLDGNITFQRSVSIISTLILNSYLKFFLDSPNTQKYMIDNAKGTAQKGFYINQLCSLPIPIPSMKEQERIVAKIEELYSVLDEIEASLRS